MLELFLQTRLKRMCRERYPRTNFFLNDAGMRVFKGPSWVNIRITFTSVL
jgi:hypothetical protein